MQPNDTIQTLDIPANLTPNTQEWLQAVFNAANATARRAMDEAEALPPAEFLRRYRREFKPVIDAHNATASWALEKMRQHQQQNQKGMSEMDCFLCECVCMGITPDDSAPCGCACDACDCAHRAHEESEG